MQKKFVLDPAYKGPLIIEEHLRKVKAQSSFTRMLSTWNKRFFVLDLKRMLFYYLPERGSALSNAKDIPFVIFKRVYLDSQLGLMDDSQMWKHGFVIISGRRSFKLISHSQSNMENLLYAFGHIIDTETNQPLFNWNEYKAQHNGSTLPLRPQMNSPPGTISEQKENSGTSVTSLASPTANRNRSNQNVEKHTTTSIADARTMSPDKGRQDDPNDRPRVHERQTSITNTANENPQPASPGKKEPRQERRLQEQSASNNTPLAQKHLNVKETDKVDVCESQVIMSSESMLVSAVQNEQQVQDQAQAPVPVEKNEKRVQNRVEVLSIDPLESCVPMSNLPSSARARQSRRSLGLELGNNIKAKPFKSNQEESDRARDEPVGNLVSPKNKGFNPYYQRLLGQEQNVREEEPISNRRKDVMQQNNQDQVNNWDTKNHANKPKLAQVDDWDREEVQVKKENVYKVEKKIDDDDDWDRDTESPPKKNKAKEIATMQKVKQDVDSWDSPPKKQSAQTNVVKKMQDDDDWDKDMSDDDNVKPKANSRFEIKTEAKYKDFTSDSGFGKPANNFKQNVVPVVKATTHNDWDDDL